MTATVAPFEVDFEKVNALPPEERALALAEIASVNDGITVNPLWNYVPHRGELGFKEKHGIPLDGTEQRGQEEFHEMNWSLTLEQGAYVAGNRSGKSHVGVADSLIQTLPEEYIPPWLLAYKRYVGDYEYRCRVVGVDLPNWLEKVMLPKLRKLIPPEALFKGAFDKAWNDRKRLLRFADGSWWDFLTHDMEVDAYSGADVDRILFDEEPSGEVGREQFEESTARIVDRDGDIRWTLTPLLGLNFVYAELTDEHGHPRDDDEIKVIRGDIDHNPHLSESGRRKFLKRLAKRDPLRMAARKSGRWVHFAGLIYDEWSDKRHVIPDAPIPRASEEAVPLVPIFASIDPGINKDHRTGLTFAWLGHDDVAEVFHSRKFDEGSTVEDVAAHFHEVCALLKFKPRWVVIDPSAQNRNHATGRSVQDEYRKHNIHTLPGQNSREAGFNAIKERLRSEPPRLVVHACNDDLIQQFGEYRWKSPKGKAEDAPKAEPVKRNDDLMDSIRYLVMQLPKPPKKKEEEEEERNLSAGTRAFREQLKRLGRKKRGRIGGSIPS